MITTMPSADEPTRPPMHHDPEDATGAFRLREGSSLPTPPMHHSNEGTIRNV